MPAQDSPLSRNEALLTPALPQASEILAALGQAVFVWDIASDAIASRYSERTRRVIYAAGIVLAVG